MCLYFFTRAPMRRRKKESARPIPICGSLKQREGRGKMKKPIYLMLSVLCAISGMPDVSFYDTLEISQTLLPQLDRHRLLDLIRYFGIAKTERHRAADDAAQTAQVFERLKQI